MEERGYITVTAPKEKDPKNGKATKVIAATGLLGFVMGLVIGWNTLPSWARYPFVLTIVLLTIYLFEIHHHLPARFLRLKRGIKARMQKRKTDKIARENFGVFRKIVNQFIDLLGKRSVLTILRELPNKVEQFSDLCIPNNHYCFYTIKSFRDKLLHFSINRDHFYWFSELFSDLVYYYVKYYIEEPSEEVKKIGKKHIPEDLRKELKKSIDNYLQFKERYKEFVEKINREVGKSFITFPI